MFLVYFDKYYKGSPLGNPFILLLWLFSFGLAISYELLGSVSWLASILILMFRSVVIVHREMACFLA